MIGRVVMRGQHRFDMPAADAGVRVEMLVVSGQEHSFDYQAGSEEKFADLFNRVFAFMVDCVHRDQS